MPKAVDLSTSPSEDPGEVLRGRLPASCQQECEALPLGAGGHTATCNH